MNQTRRIIIITGGAGGIGRAVARALLEAGHDLTLADRDDEALERARQALAADFGERRVLALAADIADERDCGGIVDKTVRHFGRVDGLFNNAGIGVSSLRPDAERNLPDILELTPELWRCFFDINLHGSYLMTRAIYPRLKANGWGRVINNTTSFFTMLRVLPYGASKAALEAASAVWANEFAADGVTVNVLVPGGPTDTAFIHDDAGLDRTKMISPQALGPPARWLISDAADGVSGQRFIAARWDPALPDEQAARDAGAPIGWPELALSTRVWPT